VRLNRHGKQPVGRLTSGADKFLDLVYDHKAELKTDRSVTFLGRTEGGIYIRKTWTLMDDKEPGSEYRLKLDLEFENNSEKTVDLGEYGLYTGSATPLWKGEWGRHITLFYLKDGDYKMKRVTVFKKGKKKALRENAGELGFAGVSDQFFATIVTPEVPYDAWVWGDRAAVRLPEAAGGTEVESIRLGMSLPDETIAAGGAKKALSFEVFMGPKRNLMLRKLGKGRGDVMNYTKFMGIGLISQGLNWTLNVLHTRIFDPISSRWSWGFAIVALTIIIRGLMWPLQNKSTRAMKRMSKLQPQMAALKEKYPDDPQRMNQEMMKMYREYGINPLGGCLPLLVQIPIFFGFYTMLQYAVELRQQKFLWVDDLALPDTIAHIAGIPINLLPIVMAATMVLQMALTPKTGDKMQRRLFMMMPLVFFFFCYSFASALALYWTTSNIFAIVQMLITRRLPEPELKKKKKGAGFWEKMQARAAEAQQMQKARRAEQAGIPPKKPKKRRPRTGG
jgi:YidC/Oxa1 family membrane protein insertase